MRYMRYACFYCLTKLRMVPAGRFIKVEGENLFIPTCNEHFKELQIRTEKTGDKTPA